MTRVPKTSIDKRRQKRESMNAQERLEEHYDFKDWMLNGNTEEAKKAFKRKPYGGRT